MGDRGGEEEGDGVGRTVVQNAHVGGTVRRGTDGLKRELEQQLRSVGLCCKAVERLCISKAQRRHARERRRIIVQRRAAPQKGPVGGGGERVDHECKPRALTAESVASAHGFVHCGRTLASAANLDW